MQKRVLGVYFSMMRRSAICAVDVMASASSRMMSLNVARWCWGSLVVGSEGVEVVGAKEEKICFVEEKVLICSLRRCASVLECRDGWTGACLFL